MPRFATVWRLAAETLVDADIVQEICRRSWALRTAANQAGWTPAHPLRIEFLEGVRSVAAGAVFPQSIDACDYEWMQPAAEDPYPAAPFWVGRSSRLQILIENFDTTVQFESERFALPIPHGARVFHADSQPHGVNEPDDQSIRHLLPSRRSAPSKTPSYGWLVGGAVALLLLVAVGLILRKRGGGKSGPHC